MSIISNRVCVCICISVCVCSITTQCVYLRDRSPVECGQAGLLLITTIMTFISISVK